MTATLMLPRFDIPTSSMSGFLLRYIVPRAGPVALFGLMAQPFLFNLIAPHSDLILGTGHGKENEYASQNRATIWKVGNYNPRQVRGKVINLLSCDTGAILGPDLVRNGARCFMGFADDIVWLASTAYYYSPWDDPEAALGLMPLIDGCNALLDGATTGEAFAIQQTGFLRNQERTDFPLLQSMLQFNYDHAVLYGDPNARISPRPRITLPIPPPPLLL